MNIGTAWPARGRYGCYGYDPSGASHEDHPHRELRNRSSEVLREVQQGESFEITNRGDVVAVLLPVARAAHAGLWFRPAVRRDGFPTLPRARLDHKVQESLDGLRGVR